MLQYGWTLKNIMLNNPDTKTANKSGKNTAEPSRSGGSSGGPYHAGFGLLGAQLWLVCALDESGNTTACKESAMMLIIF